MRFLLLASALLCASCGRAETQVADFPAQRERMVKEQVVMRGVVEERVLAAMRKVAREEFVPADPGAGPPKNESSSSDFESV